MRNYFIRRLLLLPITLACIVLVNFVIINLAPGEPTTFTEVSPEGSAMQRADRALAFGGDERYLQFREYYGLTLPILFNNWPWLSQSYVDEALQTITYKRGSIPLHEYDAIRLTFGDQARFIMPHLLSILNDPKASLQIKATAAHFFVRGGSRPGYIGSNLTQEQKDWNKKVTEDDVTLRGLLWGATASQTEIEKNIADMNHWYQENKKFYNFEPTSSEQWWIFFTDTRLHRYLSRVFHLDFGTLRNDSSKTVISEVIKRLKYSLTLSILPLFITFFFCQTIGLMMALYRGQTVDYTLNFICLVLYGIPIFVAAPFLIEKVALYHDFPFTNTPIPISGFTSPDAAYNNMTTAQRLIDVLQHIAIPVVAIMYGSLAAQARLSRTAVLEILGQDYIRTALAKGLSPATIVFKHVGRNAAIVVVTSLAGSLGIVLGGSLIVETLFDINGFGKFFYDAILNRDYNVIMFSALAGSFLTLLGYLLADLAYMWLDPRISLE